MIAVRSRSGGIGLMAVLCFGMPGNATAQTLEATAQTLDASCPQPGRWADSPETITARGVASYLAAAPLEGRAFGSQGEWCASGFIAEMLRRVGLTPVPGGDFFMDVPWRRAERPPRNVVALLPGVDGSMGPEVIVVGAHHDHVGRQRGAVHPGADDNASGVATLILVARELARGDPPRLPVLFVTFAGEEVGFHGSRRFLSAPPVPLDSIELMINLDMVGRLARGGLAIRGWDQLPEGFDRWLRTSGARMRPRGTWLPSTDDERFREVGVPSIAFFTGLHNDYHRPTDTADKLDLAGMVRIARLVARLVREL